MSVSDYLLPWGCGAVQQVTLLEVSHCLPTEDISVSLHLHSDTLKNISYWFSSLMSFSNLIHLLSKEHIKEIFQFLRLIGSQRKNYDPFLSSLTVYEKRVKWGHTGSQTNVFLIECVCEVSNCESYPRLAFTFR